MDIRRRLALALALCLLIPLVLSPSTAFSQSALLRRGSQGPAVRELQEALIRAGHNPGPTDGIFGPMTEAAVSGFQKANGLAVDGIAGPQTLLALARLSSSSRSERQPLAGKKIAIDPGHGGPNPGAIAVDGSYESHNVLAISLILRDLLQSAGAEVVMTRTTDVEPKSPFDPQAGQLKARTDIVNASGAGLFISVHNNAYPQNSAVSGVMTFSRRDCSTSMRLSRLVLDELVRATGFTNKGAETAGFYVLRNTKVPAVLAEIGFLTNRSDAAVLKTPAMRQKAAQGIYQGILRYYGVN